jgi:PAS domain S-box-containing protein
MNKKNTAKSLKENYGFAEVSGDFLFDLYRTFPVGIVFQDSNGVIIQANPAAEKILGLTVDQMCGRTSIDPRWKAIHEDGSEFSGERHPSMIALKQGVIVKNVTMGVFNPLYNKYTWIVIQAVPIFDKGKKKVVKVYTIFEDITEKKVIEHALKESENRYEKIFETIPVGLTIAKPGGEILFANSAAKKLYDITTADLEKNNANNFYTNNHDRITWLELLKKDGYVRNFEVPMVTKKGMKLIVILNIDKIRLNNEDLLLLSHRDITEKKAAQVELEQKNAALSELVGQFAIEKNKFKDDTCLFVNEILNPLIQNAKASKSPLKYIHLIEENLNGLTSSYGRMIINEPKIRLSAKEIQICSMIRSGLKNKEIGDISGIAVSTVETMRKTIRKKIGLTGKKNNLESYLKQSEWV